MEVPNTLSSVGPEVLRTEEINSKFDLKNGGEGLMLVCMEINCGYVQLQILFQSLLIMDITTNISWEENGNIAGILQALHFIYREHKLIDHSPT